MSMAKVQIDWTASKATMSVEVLLLICPELAMSASVHRAA